MEEGHTRIHEDKAIEDAAQTGARWLRSPYASWWLAGVSFIESVFAPIIIDPFLIALIFAERAKWIRYTLISVGGSVLGGLVGYALGALFFDTIGVKLVETFGFTERFNDVARGIDANGFVFVLIGAVTPIPYKLIALASGFLHVNIFTFLIASIFGRSIRLGLVGFAAYALGPHALPIIRRHLHLFATITAVVLIGYILFKVL